MFKWVASIDIAANEEADANVLVKLCESFTDQAAQVGGANVLCVNTQSLSGCLSRCQRNALTFRLRSNFLSQCPRRPVFSLSIGLIVSAVDFKCYSELQLCGTILPHKSKCFVQQPDETHLDQLLKHTCHGSACLFAKLQKSY